MDREESRGRGGTEGRLSPHLEVMRSMIRDFNRMFEGLPYTPAISSARMSSWPRIEVFERDQTLVVRAELPGLEREDVRVRVQDDSLMIEGERRSDMESRREGYYESEWSYGRFSRRIPLPAGADPDQVRAQFRNGILEVTVGLPRPATREIPIQSEGRGGREAPGSEAGRPEVSRRRATAEVSGAGERGGTTT